MVYSSSPIRIAFILGQNIWNERSGSTVGFMYLNFIKGLHHTMIIIQDNLSESDQYELKGTPL